MLLIDLPCNVSILSTYVAIVSYIIYMAKDEGINIPHITNVYICSLNYIWHVS